VILLLAGLALAFAPLLVSGALVALLLGVGGRGTGTRVHTTAGVARVVAYAACVPAVLWVLARAGLPAESLFSELAGPRLGATLGIAAALALALGVLSAALQGAGALVLRWAYRASGRTPAPPSVGAAAAGRYPALLAIAIAVAAAGYEELVWRALVQAGITPLLGVTAAVLVASLAFAAVHARQGPVAVVFSGVAAVLLGAAFVWRGDLSAVVLAHAAYNSGAVLLDRWRHPAAPRPAAAAGGPFTAAVGR
jgi:membrane protease YdiL (CAAX protease family)